MNTQNPANLDMIQSDEVNTQKDLMIKLERFNLSSLGNTFETFKKLQGTEAALNVFKKLGVGKSDRKFVFLYGATGCGKTHLIEATIIAWAKRGLPSRYQTMSEMVRMLKSSLKVFQGLSYDDLFKAICDRDRLIIDDYGMGTQETKFEVAELEDIINERYHRRYYPEDKVTILATNKHPNEIPDRVLSRFYDPEFGVVVKIGAGDYRRRKL